MPPHARSRRVPKQTSSGSPPCRPTAFVPSSVKDYLQSVPEQNRIHTFGAKSNCVWKIEARAKFLSRSQNSGSGADQESLWRHQAWQRLLEMKDLHGIKRQQIAKACQALLKHVEKQKSGTKDLLEEDEVIYLVSTISHIFRDCGDGDTLCSRCDIRNFWPTDSCIEYLLLCRRLLY